MARHNLPHNVYCCRVFYMFKVSDTHPNIYIYIYNNSIVYTIFSALNMPTI